MGLIFKKVLMRVALSAYSFSDDFNRANGAIGGDWTGATWTIASNKVVNTPTLSAELLANPGMEGVYVDESGGGGGTVNVAPDWDASGVETDGTDTLDEEAVIVHGGAKSQKLDVDAKYESVDTALAVFATGKWYRVMIELYGDGGGIKVFDSSQAYLDDTVTPGAIWTNYLWTFRALSNRTLRISGWETGGIVFYVDDVSNKECTLSTLFASIDHETIDVTADVDLVITAGTQAGLVINLDSAGSPANFVIAYHDGTNAVLEKCVAGTYTSVISAAAAYGAGHTLRVIKNGTSYSLYYNGVQIGTTQVISDAGIINNTIHGLFSTYSSNTMDNYTVSAT